MGLFASLADATAVIPPLQPISVLIRLIDAEINLYGTTSLGTMTPERVIMKKTRIKNYTLIN